MKKRTSHYLTLALILVLSFLTATATAAVEVYILHTNNTNGALENCLCPDKAYGSLEKRVLYIREWLREHPNTLVLDAGDFLSASRNTLKDSIAFRAYEMIRYDAIGLGDQEFFRGVEFISNLMRDSKLPFVSTNLNKPELPNVSDELIVTQEGITFGILSVINRDIFRLYPKDVSEAIEMVPYEDIIQGRVTDLKEKVDVVILLSHLGIDKDREVARTVSDIDVVIGSHDQAVLENPEKVGKSIIVQAGKDGYYVGQLKLTFDEKRNIESYTGELIPMDITLPNDSAVVAMIVEYNRLSRIRAGTRVERIVPIPPSFIVTSSGKCGSCHQNELDHWLTTSHAASFKLLKSEHKEKSPECLACHTTGFGRDDGYLNYNITAELKNVNCTECHWATGEHLDDPNLHRSEAIKESHCIRCHDQVNSPEFEFQSFMERIQHPVAVTSVFHQIQEGETLWSLAEQYLGHGSQWPEIFELNRGIIENPGKIYAVESLKIPVDSGAR